MKNTLIVYILYNKWLCNLYIAVLKKYLFQILVWKSLKKERTTVFSLAFTISPIFSFYLSFSMFSLFLAYQTNRIRHWCSMETGKSQPEGPQFQWETRLAEFPTRTVDPRVRIFLSTLNINGRFFFSHTHRIVLRMTPVCLNRKHSEVNERNKTKIQQSQTMLVPKCPFCPNKENAYPHLIFYSQIKGAIDV